MPDIIEQMHRHRSIRRYTGDALPDADVRRAVAAGQAASTSSAVQSYCIIRVTDRERRERLVELTGGQKKVAACGGFFAVCGDARRHRLINARAERPYAAHLEGFLLAVVDATLFAQNLALAFESLGYGMCFIGGLRNDLDAVQKLLRFPEGVYPLYGLCVGVADETPLPRPRMAVDAVLFDDCYPTDEEMLRHLDAYDETYRDYLRNRGAAPRGWSEGMVEKFAQPQRTTLAEYYRRQGADFS